MVRNITTMKVEMTILQVIQRGALLKSKFKNSLKKIFISTQWKSVTTLTRCTLSSMKIIKTKWGSQFNLPSWAPPQRTSTFLLPNRSLNRLPFHQERVVQTLWWASLFLFHQKANSQSLTATLRSWTKPLRLLRVPKRTARNLKLRVNKIQVQSSSRYLKKRKRKAKNQVVSKSFQQLRRAQWKTRPNSK